MVIKICPHCKQRYVTDEHTGDFVHECSSGNLAIDQEDVVVVGNWTDYSGSGINGAQEVLMQGAANELQGKRAQIEYGEDKEKETRRGVRASTHRQRQHEQYINLTNGGLD
jgi:hypothetical protein